MYNFEEEFRKSVEITILLILIIYIILELILPNRIL